MAVVSRPSAGIGFRTAGGVPISRSGLASSGHVSPFSLTGNHSSRAAVCGSTSISCTVRTGAAGRPQHERRATASRRVRSFAGTSPASVSGSPSATTWPSLHTIEAAGERLGSSMVQAVCVAQAAMSCIDRSMYWPAPVRSR